MNDKILMIKEQFTDILQALNCNYVLQLEHETIKNTFGGNPTEKVAFCLACNDIPYKEKIFIMHYANKTQDQFLDEIKSYLFSVLDSVVNL